MEKRSSFMTPLFLFLFLLLIIAALQLEASVIKKTFHYVDEKKNWSDAQQYCKEKFTDLASPGDQREDLLNEIVTNGRRATWIWIGLYRDPGDISVWRWTGERGDASLDTNWATGELEIWNCTRVSRDKMWKNVKCSEKRWSSYCSNGDSVLRETEYMSWFDAQESCNKKSMVLATVTQSNQHTFPGRGWIGLHLPPNTPGSYTSKDVWKWIGTDSDYRNWAPGQPDLKNCGILSVNTDKWYSVPCSRKLPFMCVDDNVILVISNATPASTLNTTPALNTPTTPNTTREVILVKENKTWEEALEHCRAIGSVDSSQHNHYRDHQYDLVSLQSEDDHRYARDKIQEATTNEVWTALRFLAGQWLWVDGEPQQYQNLPLCPAWGRHCGTLPKDHSTQWQIRDCMERRNFLCIKSPAG